MRPLLARSFALALCAVFTAPLAGFVALLPVPALADTQEVERGAVFDQASRLIRDNFYDRSLRGLDWERVNERHRPAYVAAKSGKERSAAINAMLAELDASHMFHFTREDPAYYQLLGIFQHSLRNDIKKHLDGDISFPGIGIFTRAIDSQTFVSGVVSGLPADAAGLKVGDEILGADGGDFEPVRSFRGKTGQKVVLKVRREREGSPLDITVEPKSIDSAEAFESAIAEGARIIEVNGKKIGYVRIWSYAGQRYQQALADVLSTGKLKDADALIWDLRDGWGGAQPHYLDIFNARAPDMTFTDRRDEPQFVSFRWRKPAAILANRGTRSGKEVLTYGFKKYGYGEVIGETTAGALLAGRGFMLDDGSFLMVAVSDVAVDGERLEAKGVEPTIPVSFDIRYANGRDPQLDKAVELLSAPRG
jgi:carboxyl-terminal processing protease